jgi:hypothetical protein
MQFDDAVLEARRLAADGNGATDWVILAALADKVVQQEIVLAQIQQESNMRHDGLLVLSESIHSHLKALNNDLGRLELRLNQLEKRLYDFKKLATARAAKPAHGRTNNREQDDRRL